MWKHELIFQSGCDIVIDSYWEMLWHSTKRVEGRRQRIINRRTAEGWKLIAYSVS